MHNEFNVPINVIIYEISVPNSVGTLIKRIPRNLDIGIVGVLQKPQIIFSEGGDFDTIEMGRNLGNHFGIFDGDREILLPDEFPVHAAKLINLINLKFNSGKYHLVFVELFNL